MNILFTCVGRRVELIQEFKKNSSDDFSVYVYGTDSSDTAPALRFCDFQFISPLIKDVNYLPFLLKTCEENKIDLLIPTIDTDLIVLSENKELFAKIGTKVLVSSAETIKRCRDKRLTGELFEKAGLCFPTCVDKLENYSSGYPAFIKPMNGSSSIDAYKANNPDELAEMASRVPNYIIQPYIKGEEYTIDILCDFDGTPIYITPRRRLAIRSGEVAKTEVYQDPVMIDEAKRLVEVMKPVGPITVQLIKDTNTDWYIEINPRFGGGAPLSMKAGADSSLAIIDIYRGLNKKYDISAAKNHSVFCRFDQSIQVK